jgi:hypothetical protein
MKRLAGAALLAAAWLGFHASGYAADTSANDDEELLRRAGVGPEPVLVVKFLANHARASDPKGLEQVVRRLGSESFEEREAAGAFLLRTGGAAVPSLRRAAHDADAEIARRARDCLRKIETTRPGEVVLAAVRLIVRHRPAGSAEALLEFLVVCDDDLLEEETFFGLHSLAKHDANVLAALAEALRDPAPARRRAAACIVGRLGSSEQRAAVRRLLDDVDAEVRLRAAQGLLAGGDKTAVPALIDLLRGTPVPLAATKTFDLAAWVADRPAAGNAGTAGLAGRGTAALRGRRDRTAADGRRGRRDGPPLVPGGVAPVVAQARRCPRPAERRTVRAAAGPVRGP